MAGTGQQILERRTVSHPERLIPMAFLIGIAAGTLLLMMPIARAGATVADGGAGLVVALFTATSALCVTGLAVVDTPSYWSPFGHGIILLLFQLGGFGIMTGATLLGLFINRQMPLSNQLLACAEMRNLDLGDVKAVIRLVIVATFAVEALLAVWITLALALGHDIPLARAVWFGVFHAVSAFNNAGFSVLPQGLLPFSDDPFMLSPLMIGCIVGGIGFPVLYDLRRNWRVPPRWTIHTKLTLFGTVTLLLLGTVVTLLFEWDNPGTLAAPGVGIGEKLLGALFHSVNTRTAGFNAHDTAAMNMETLLVSSGLMLIGGGSAGTAGGIRVTTFLLLGFVVWSEIRGERDAVAFRRRIAPEAQRQAVAIVLLAVGVLAVAVLMLASLSAAPLERLLFEAVSAFATAGLSTGLSGELPPAGQIVLVVLMYVGRIGTITLAAAFTLRSRGRPFRYPEERPIVG